MRLATHLSIAAAVVMLLSTSSAFAAATYTGSDNGAAVGGPYTNSAAAQAAFLSAAAVYGSVTTDGFEAAPLGYAGTVALSGASISSASPNFGSGFSGVSNTTLGNVYGFNTTAGGTKWYGFPNTGPASATITFASGTHSLGFWLTGVQTLFTSSITLLQHDGSSLLFNLPVNTNGGTNFFGVVDSNSFTSATLTLNSSGDAWGIDDISFNGAMTGVPEASTWGMLLAGFGFIGVASRRRRALVAA